MNLWLAGEKAGRIGWEFRIDSGHTDIFKTDNQQGPAVSHRELCSILCNNLKGKEFEKE